MFRNLLVALAVTASVLGAAGIEQKAEAADPRINISFGGPNWSVGYSNGYRPHPGYYPSYYPPAVQQHYHVYYRTCHSEPWRVHGTYHSHSYAHEVVDRLEWRGYRARVAHH